jgi:hypothetical protein
LQPKPIEPNDASSTLEAHAQPHGLELLPSELLERITEHLPPLSTLSLRQASRSLALKIPLDDRFWRRHLCSGNLLPCLWDLDETELKQLLQSTPSEQPWDWQRLACVLRSDQFQQWGQDPLPKDVPVGLWNRYRIWSILNEACTSPNARTNISAPVHHYRREKAALRRGGRNALGLFCFAFLFALVAACDMMYSGQHCFLNRCL